MVGNREELVKLHDCRLADGHVQGIFNVFCRIALELPGLCGRAGR